MLALFFYNILKGVESNGWKHLSLFICTKETLSIYMTHYEMGEKK